MSDLKKIIIILILAIFTSGCMNVNDTDSDVNKNKDSNLKSEKSTKVKPKKFEKIGRASCRERVSHQV